VLDELADQVDVMVNIVWYLIGRSLGAKTFPRGTALRIDAREPPISTSCDESIDLVARGRRIKSGRGAGVSDDALTTAPS
jgi:hypothetical protein